MSARPDVFQAKEAIHQNPAGALAPVPLMGLPLLLENIGRQNSQEVLRLILHAQAPCQSLPSALASRVLCLLPLPDLCHLPLQAMPSALARPCPLPLPEYLSYPQSLFAQQCGC